MKQRSNAFSDLCLLTSDHMSKPLAIGVIGVGHMGRHHARVVDEADGVELAAVVDPREDVVTDVAELYGCRGYTDLAEAMGSLDAAIVAVPTAYHLQVTEPLIHKRIPVLVEKPLAATVAEAQKLAALAAENDCFLQVGHSERFNPAVAAVARLQITPKFVEVDRVSPFPFRSIDIGVVLDVMIHDIDIVMSLIGQPPSRIDAVGVALMGEHEDIANARLGFDNGAVANLTASRLAMKVERKIRIFSPQAYVTMDFRSKRGMVIRREENEQLLDWVSAHRQDPSMADHAPAKYEKLVNTRPLEIDETEPLRGQLHAFLEAIRSGRPAQVDAEAGLAAVRVATDIATAIRAHDWQH